jgi:hypothetical protein
VAIRWSTSASLTFTRLSTSRSRRPLHRDLVADVVAVLGERDAFTLDRLAEVVVGQLVVLGDARQRALDLRVVDADAGLLRVLQQHALGDEPLEQLLLEHVGRGRRDVGGFHLAQHDALLLVDVVLRERLVVDDRDDAVDRHRLFGRRSAGRRARGTTPPAGRLSRAGGAAPCANAVIVNAAIDATTTAQNAAATHRAARGPRKESRDHSEPQYS